MDETITMEDTISDGRGMTGQARSSLHIAETYKMSATEAKEYHQSRLKRNQLLNEKIKLLEGQIKMKRLEYKNLQTTNE